MAFSGDLMDSTEKLSVLTIGHSTHTYYRFLELLRSAGVTAVADVRSAPYSRHRPQFNADNLKLELQADGVAYSFLGRELGGRPAEKRLYQEGVADYNKMAVQPNFTHGLTRVLDGARKFRIALMCSEQDPLDCHRCLLVGRALCKHDANVSHILSTGNLISQVEIEEQLLRMAKRQDGDLFMTRDERLATAYFERGRKVAFAEAQDVSPPLAAE